MGAIRGKIVLAVINGPQGGRTEQYGLAQFSGWNDGDSDWVQDNYNVKNTGAIATKRDQVGSSFPSHPCPFTLPVSVCYLVANCASLSQVRRFLDLTNAGDQTKMYVNFCSGSSVFAFPDEVAAGAFGTQVGVQFLLPFFPPILFIQN
jgi:1-phosphatidylinositol phosphodiesterase